MKKLIKLLGFGIMVMIVFVFMSSLVTVSASADKGTLMGNSEGTKFCCAAGTNDCAATKCSTDME